MRLPCCNSVIAAVLLASSTAFAREVPLRIEPPQVVAALAIESGGNVSSVPVKNGRLQVPDSVALPWKVSSVRFEPAVYTAADMAAGKPFVVRELGRLSATIVDAGRPLSRPFDLLLLRNGAASADERHIPVDPTAPGNFDVRVPAGVYQLAALSDTCASGIRSALTVGPGAVTNAGNISCLATVPVTFRVIDARSSAPVAGAQAVWDPVGPLNANAARVLYASRWKGTSNRAGVMTVRVGPTPIPVRWRISAAGYANEWTTRMNLAEPVAAVLPDVRLTAQIVLRVHTLLPRDADDFERAALIIGDRPDERTYRFVERKRFPLAEKVEIPIDAFGQKRLWIEDRKGRKLFYRDVQVTPDSHEVELIVRPLEVRGRVTATDGVVTGASVTLADPHDAHMILARATTDSSGDYALRTYARGDLLLYAGRHAVATNTGVVTQRVHAATEQESVNADLVFPSGGAVVRVVDAASGQPVVAKIDGRVTTRDSERATFVFGETDVNGQLTLAGYPPGAADLDVSARGYRHQRVQVKVDDSNDRPEVVRLEAGRSLQGAVVDERGAPVPNALLSAEFDDEWSVDGHVRAVSDGGGRFHVDSPPPPGTPFYVIAAGHALAIAYLDDDRENIVRMSPLGTRVLRVTEQNAPPQNMLRIVASPHGGQLIPYGVLDDLADANGVTDYQLLGTSRDGTVALPQFLGPGTWDFYVTRKKGTQSTFERIGVATLPLTSSPVLNAQ